MNFVKEVTKVQGNSPLKDYPSDYFPKDCGFWFELSEGLDENKKMFFRESKHGNGEPENTIVFVHGNPECSYTYRKVISNMLNLSKKPFRIVSMDHIGYGLSDQATYEMVCMDHAENLLQLIKFLDLENVTLIIHDWGGPIGIGAFLKVPEKVSNLVILNSTVFPMPETGLTYKTYPSRLVSWAKSPRLIANEYWGAFAASIIFLEPIEEDEMLLTNLMSSIREMGNGNFPHEEKTAQRVYKQQFDSEANILSSKRLVLQTPVWGYGNIYDEPSIGKRETTDFYRNIQEKISKTWGPDGQNIGVRALCGKWDPSAKDEVIQQWVTHLPQLEGHVKTFENVSHFIEEHKPKEIAKTIIELANLG
ncbi:MAG: alpha/beta fold hydrolase [Promethearchaeota archaeon]